MAWKLELGIKTPDTKGFIKAIKKAGTSLKKLDKESKNTDDAMEKLKLAFKQAGVGLATFVTGVIFLNKVIEKATGAYADFEDKLVAIGRIAGVNSEQIGVLEESFRALAVQTGISTAVIAEFAEQGARFGIRGVEELKDFTESMTLLGAVTGNVTAKMVKDLARVNELTDGEGSSFANMSNAIVELGNNFATSEAQIARTTARIATDLAQFNVGTDFALGLGTALDSMGISAERGGSAMQRLAASLKDAAVDGGPAIRDLAKEAGLTQKAFTEMVEANPAEAVIELAKAGADSSRVLDLLSIKGVRATAVFSTLAANSGSLAKSMDLASSSIKQTNALMDQSAIQAETLKNLQKRLAEATDQVASAFGQEVADSSKDYLNTLIKVTEEFNGTADASEGSLEGIKLLGEESRKWFGILSDIRSLAVVPLAAAFDRVAGKVAGISKDLEIVGEAVFGGAIEGITNLLDVNEALTIELETQIEQQTFLDKLAVDAWKKREKDKKAEIVLAASLTDEAIKLAAIQDKVFVDSKRQKNNYEDNVEVIKKSSAAFRELLNIANEDLTLAGLSDVDRQLENSAISLRESLAEAGAEFNKAFTASREIGTAQSDLSKMVDDFEAIVAALEGLSDIEIKEITESVRADRDDAFADLDKANDKLTELQEKVATPEANTAAIASQAEGIAFASNIAAQNQKDTLEAQLRKKAIEEARKQRDEAADLVRELNESVKNLAKGTYSG